MNARVWSGDQGRPWADALLITGDRIELVGSSAEVQKRAAALVPTVDAGGMLVTPGFVDAHVQLALGDLESETRRLASQGVTSVQHMGEWEDVEILRAAHERGALRARVRAAVPLDAWSRLRDDIARLGRGDAWLQLGGVTGSADTALHEAAFAADAAGMQLMLQAGDGDGLSLRLDLLARIAEARGARDRRARLDGALQVSPGDAARLAELGVVLCVHPARAAVDADYRRLRDAGARLVFGSGGPASRAAPFEAICAAFAGSRRENALPGGRDGARAFAVGDALRACTSGAAWAGFQEKEVGILKPGMLADLVMIDRDITRAAPGDIRDARVVLTLVGGHPVFDAMGLVPCG